VLSCNNYEIVDLGVMVPTETILETARKEIGSILYIEHAMTIFWLNFYGCMCFRGGGAANH
jgi:cobalamin-dependent methionine synthase I